MNEKRDLNSVTWGVERLVVTHFVKVYVKHLFSANRGRDVEALDESKPRAGSRRGLVGPLSDFAARVLADAGEYGPVANSHPAPQSHLRAYLGEGTRTESDAALASSR